MVRGTTPTFTFNIKDEAVDLTGADVYLTLSDIKENELMTKRNEELDIELPRTVKVTLTQAETLSLPEGKMKAQLNWTYQNGLTRNCTVKVTINNDTNLLDKEL